MSRDHQRDPVDFTPLPAAALHIILAIGPGERHGYAVMGEVERITGGRVRLGPGSLYGTIKRLVADGLIEESGRRPDPALDDERRRYYRLTGLGQAVARLEAERLDGLLRESGARRWALGAT